jgi:hypothetical protein
MPSLLAGIFEAEGFPQAEVTGRAVAALWSGLQIYQLSDTPHDELAASCHVAMAGLLEVARSSSRRGRKLNSIVQP